MDSIEQIKLLITEKTNKKLEEITSFMEGHHKHIMVSKNTYKKYHKILCENDEIIPIQLVVMVNDEEKKIGCLSAYEGIPIYRENLDLEPTLIKYEKDLQKGSDLTVIRYQMFYEYDPEYQYYEKNSEYSEDSEGDIKKNTKTILLDKDVMRIKHITGKDDEDDEDSADNEIERMKWDKEDIKYITEGKNDVEFSNRVFRLLADRYMRGDETILRKVSVKPETDAKEMTHGMTLTTINEIVQEITTNIKTLKYNPHYEIDPYTTKHFQILYGFYHM